MPESEEALEEISEDTEKEEVEGYERKKKGAGKAKRRALPSDLPREVVTYDIPEADKICPCCQGQKTCFSKEVTEQLKVIPPQVVVISHQRLKYCCQVCEGELSIGPKPDLFLPKSMADASLVAYTIVMKYADHLPLYRQEHIWARNKIELPRNTTCAWIIKAAELCAPIRDEMKRLMLASGYNQVDETEVQVLREAQRKDTQKSYMWVYRRAVGTPILVYDYQQTRQAIHPQTALKGFKGYLQTDDYAGYDWLDKSAGVIHFGCWAHVRRRFAEVQKLAKKQKGLAYQALEWIGKLYHIEKEIRDQNREEKHRYRQEHGKPLLDKIKTWLTEHIHEAPPKGKLGEAMNYMKNNWEKLIVYVQNGDLGIDNNLIENSIRPFALGRRNWLFMGNPKGAEAGAVLYSLLMTAKENGLNQHAYLTFVFNRIRSCKTNADYQKLIPGYLTPEEHAALSLK